MSKGRLNPSWSALRYDPHQTVNKPSAHLHITDDATDTLLRQKVRSTHYNLQSLYTNVFASLPPFHRCPLKP